MLSFSPISSTPYSALNGDVFYAKASLNINTDILENSNIKFYESIKFDCFGDLLSSLYVKRQINVYYTVYVTQNQNYTLSVKTTDSEILYRALDFTSNFYISSDLNYKLTLNRSLDFILNVVKETQDGF